MKSHELAKLLLKLPNKHITIVKSIEGPYTEDMIILGNPWDDNMGAIRIQIINIDLTEKTGD